jgi:tether containing UBX domain for GLUT4
MASHLVIVHPSARTAKINTTPGKYLTDVRDEACLKFNLKPEQYTLKYVMLPFHPRGVCILMVS